MDPTQNNGFGNSNGFGNAMPSGGMGDVPSGQPMNMGAVNPGMPLSFGSGDIILAPEKKSKKWWIVGVIAVVFVIIVSCCIVWMSVNSENVLAGDAKSVFDDYERYMLLGEVDEDDDGGVVYNDDRMIADVTLDNAYYVDVTELAQFEEQRLFFQVAYEYLSDLSKLVDDESLKVFIGGLIEDTEVMKQLSIILNTDYVLRKYTNNEIDDYLGELDGLRGETHSMALYDAKSLVLEYKKLYGLFDENNCVDDDGLDGDCTNLALKNNPVIDQTFSKVLMLRRNTNVHLENLRSMVYIAITNLRGRVK